MTTKKKPIKAKPTTRIVYSEALVDRICDRIAQGESLLKICQDSNMPSYGGVMKWLNENQGQIVEKYGRAREAQADFYADQIVQISDNPVIGVKTKTNERGEVETVEGDMVEHRRLQIDARKWYASKVAPKKYGDKQEVVHSGQVDIANALAEARGRVGNSN